MNKDEILDLLNEKLNQNEEKIVINFYELKIKRNIKNDDLFDALHTISTILTDNNYKVYRTNQKYIFKNEEHVVESNELMIGIKE